MSSRVLAASLVAVLTLVACGGDGGDGTAQPESAEPAAQVDHAEAVPLQSAFQGLCDAQSLAEADDLWGAADAFNADAHAFLHEFAAQLSASDRAAAAAVLQAKEAVEAQLNTPDDADPAETARALTQLQEALADGAEVEGLPRPECGSGSA